MVSYSLHFFRFFELDGVRNPKVQSVYFKDMPIHQAAFFGKHQHPGYLITLNASIKRLIWLPEVIQSRMMRI